MNDITSLTALVGVGAAVLGTVIAFLASKAVYGRRLGDVAARLDKIERSRAQANEMLQQAKKQIESLQRDLEDARRDGRKTARAESAKAGPARADDQAQSIAEARAKLDRMLDAPESLLGSGFFNSGLAHGFADTQPVSGFGPTQPNTAA